MDCGAISNPHIPLAGSFEDPIGCPMPGRRSRSEARRSTAQENRGAISKELAGLFSIGAFHLTDNASTVLASCP